MGTRRTLFQVESENRGERQNVIKGSEKRSDSSGKSYGAELFSSWQSLHPTEWMLLGLFGLAKVVSMV